jgi:tetratricopeptide (TPR) repeat protein
MTAGSGPTYQAYSSLWALCFHPFSVLRSFVATSTIMVLHALGANRWLNADYTHAEIAFKLVLRIRPDHRDTLFQLAEMYYAVENVNGAIEVMEDWLTRFPCDVRAHTIVSKLYTLMRHTKKAKEHLEISWGLASDSPDVLGAYGLFHRWNGNLEESSEFLRVALERQESVLAQYNLAENLIDSGDQAEAIKLLDRAVRLAPDFEAPYYTLAECGHYRELSNPHITYMVRRLGKGGLTPTARAGFHFALGETYDRLGLWDEAFAHFKAGNDLSPLRSCFSIEGWTEHIDEQIKTFDRELLKSMSQSHEGPYGEGLIFVVGMPRCGSTLVEQILASHADVYAGGERRDLMLLIEQLCAEVKEPFPACVRRIDAAGFSVLRRRYLERVSGLFVGYLRFVDKCLTNFLQIGLIMCLFPKAKIIHCRRNALDTCFSCYRKNLLHVPFSHDLGTLGLVYRQYERQIGYWHSLLPGRILDVQYEELVSEPEAQIRDMLTYCELSWDPACMSPHEKRRPVCTASATQVKLPINSRSIGRWKSYEKHLRPLIEALGTSGQGWSSNEDRGPIDGPPTAASESTFPID